MPQRQGGVQRGEGVQPAGGVRPLPVQRPPGGHGGRHRRHAHAVGRGRRLDTARGRAPASRLRPRSVLLPLRSLVSSEPRPGSSGVRGGVTCCAMLLKSANRYIGELAATSRDWLSPSLFPVVVVSVSSDM